jgi:methylglyoxal/glyoxal reductase
VFHAVLSLGDEPDCWNLNSFVSLKQRNRAKVTCSKKCIRYAIVSSQKIGVCMKNNPVFKSLASHNHKLNSGFDIPVLGLGVWQVNDGNEVEEATLKALEMGYRLIDTAAIYGNEVGVGKALARSGVPRSEIFVTTKLWNEDIRKANEQQAFNTSLDKLGLDYADLYLIHWPIAGRIVEPWIELTKIAESKRARSIGVSNYHEHHLQELLAKSGIVPALNQVEINPLLQNKSLRKFCASKGIAVQAWSPLMQGKFAGNAVLDSLATKHKRSVPQVILRWNIQENILTIPKTTNPVRMAENAQAFDFELDANDMKAIAALDCGKRFGPDPDHFDF